MSKTILRLRGLPWSAGELEIRSFLGEPRPKEVFLRKRGEKSTGEAFAEYENPEEALEALGSHNNHILGERYIEIFLADAESMEALKEEVQEQDTGWVVRMRGLPFAANAEDVLEFFDGLEVLRGAAGVVFCWGRDGRPLGEAYVEFPSEDVQLAALQYDRQKMGSRYVELFKSTKADMLMRATYRWQKRSNEQGVGLFQRQRGFRPLYRMSESGAAQYPMLPFQQAPYMLTGIPMEAYTLRVRGLPLDATVGDVISFFSGFEVDPDAIQLISRPGPGGKSIATGLANVRFSSPAIAESARRRQHGRRMGSNRVECLSLAPHLQGQQFPGPAPMLQGPPNPFLPQSMGPMGVLVGMSDFSRPNLGPSMSPRPSVEYPYDQSSLHSSVQAVSPHRRNTHTGTPPHSPFHQGRALRSQFTSDPSSSDFEANPSPGPSARRGWGGYAPMTHPQGALPPYSAASYQHQQHLLMHQYLIQQQYLQQQAMSQMQQGSWGILQGQGMPPMAAPLGRLYAGLVMPGRGQARPMFPSARPPPYAFSTPPRRSRNEASALPEEVISLGSLSLHTNPVPQSLESASQSEVTSQPFHMTSGQAASPVMPSGSHPDLKGMSLTRQPGNDASMASEGIFPPVGS